MSEFDSGKYLVRLRDILHFSRNSPAFDVEDRNDRCAISIDPNMSLRIEYIDRNGVRVTTKVKEILDHCFLTNCEGRDNSVYVLTRNSWYVFEVDEGKYDEHEISDLLNQDLAVYNGLYKAVGAFAQAFA